MMRERETDRQTDRQTESFNLRGCIRVSLTELTAKFDQSPLSICVL